MSQYADQDETCEIDCLEPYNCTDATDLDVCNEVVCTQTCDGYNHTTCTVNFEFEGEWLDLDCQTFWEEFNGDESDDNSTCGMQCEQYYDCSSDLMMPFCEVSTCMDPCTYEGECYVDFAWEGEEAQRWDCEEFMDEFMPDDEDNNCTAGDNFNTTEADCMEMVMPYVNGVEYCFYTETVDTCTWESIECQVQVVVNGTDYEGSCDEIAEQFGVPVDEDDDDDDEQECDDYECTLQYDCTEDYQQVMRSCEVYECLNECTGETECMVNFHHRDNTEGYVDCETFYSHMEDDDDDDENDEECDLIESEGDCLEMV